MPDPLVRVRRRLAAAITWRVDAAVTHAVGPLRASLSADVDGAQRSTAADVERIRSEHRDHARHAARLEAQVNDAIAALNVLATQVAALESDQRELQGRLAALEATTSADEEQAALADAVERVRTGFCAASVALVDQQRAHGELLERAIARIRALEHPGHADDVHRPAATGQVVAEGR
jgi:septal ring factor EnvC (AmiA/AmiB activator)